MRKHTRRRPVTPLPPPGLRPRLSHGQLVDLGLVHLANLDNIAQGRGTEELLWQWAGGAFTWSFIAQAMCKRYPASQQLAEAAAAVAAQLETCTRVIERYGRTGRVGFAGPELQAARGACEWMDALAEVVDQPTAVDAANRSEQLIAKMARAVLAREKDAA